MIVHVVGTLEPKEVVSSAYRFLYIGKKLMLHVREARSRSCHVGTPGTYGRLPLLDPGGGAPSVERVAAGRHVERTPGRVLRRLPDRAGEPSMQTVQCSPT